MSAEILHRTRRIDGGLPLTLWDPPAGDGAAGYAVTTAICDNPLCPCTRISLTIRRLQRLDDGSFETHGALLGAEVSSDGTDLKIDDGSGVFKPTTTDWLRARLLDQDHRDWLHERWSRSRGQIGDPAYLSGVPPQGVEGMLSFSEVFPYDFDLIVIDDGHLYWANDNYCLKPACTCDELAVQFLDPEKAASIGHVSVSVHKFQKPNVHGPALIRRLWRALLDRYGTTPLRERFQRMRAIALQPAFTPQPAVAISLQRKVGRNDACQCGSGKKHKHCCGA